jgi:spoIIIJ-associated protein
MDKYIYEAKTKEEALNKAITELNTTEDSIIVKVLEEKNTLLKKSVKIEVIKYNDITSYLKKIITNILKDMNIESNLEIKKRDNQIEVEIYSDNNAILIGKNGKNIQALQLILRQILNSQVGQSISLTVDVENYREKRNKNLEYLAKKVAKEVARTKVETKLDSMNSYERRIVHNALSDNKYVYTESIGEEPNRCIVIKPKED